MHIKWLSGYRGFWGAATCLLLLMGLSLPASAAPQVPNTMEQRLAACSQCHGKQGQGIVNKPKIPHLASKPAGYLYQQLQSFKTGKRHNPAMQYVVRQLSPAYLKDIAHYYAAQPIGTRTVPVPDVSDAVMQRGEQLAKHGDPDHSVPSCQRCHGPSLTGVKPMIPGVIGLSYDYLQAQLQQWRSDERSSAGTHCMWVVANRMQQSDIEAVAAWLASQPLPADQALIRESDLPQSLPGWCHVAQSEVTE